MSSAAVTTESQPENLAERALRLAQKILWLAVFVMPLVACLAVGYWRYRDQSSWFAMFAAVWPDVSSDADAYMILRDTVWSCIVVLVVATGLRVWLGGKPDATRQRVRYVYVWLLGVALFAFVGPALLNLLLPNLTVAVRVLSESTALPVIWSVVVFLWLVFRGDGSNSAKNYLGQYRTVWTLLSLMVGLLILVDLSAYQSVRDRVTGLQASINDAQTGLNRLAPSQDNGQVGFAISFDQTAYQLLSSVDLYYQNALYASPAESVSDDDKTVARKQSLDDVAARLVNARYWALVAETEARLALRLTELPASGGGAQPLASPQPTPTAVTAAATPAVADGAPATGSSAQASAFATPTAIPTSAPARPALTTDRTHEWLQQPRQVIKQTADTAAAALVGLDHADAELNRLRTTPTAAFDTLDRIVGSEVYLNAHEVAGQAPVARNALAAVSLPVAPVFIWISVFYALLLGVPSLLLLLFFIRKRDQRAAQILADLSRLDPDQGLVLRALGIEPLHDNTNDEPKGSADVKESNVQEYRLQLARQAVLRRRTAFRNHKAFDEQDAAIPYVIDRIAQRAFSNMEYAIALTLLTGLLGLGWYFVFYPDATAGLASLIGGGGGVDQVTNYLASPSPITFGFIGAYFWSFQMLLRRYLAGDLYPSAFLQASQRIVIVFVLSLVLSILGVLPVAGAGGGIAVVAFATGIFPQSGLSWILDSANRAANKRIFPTTLEQARLTQLDGIDVWIESRLLEEKIENIQGLATAAIEMLVLRTNFPTTQIVDWIDQALLYLHAGDEGKLFSALRMSGVRTASDLLDASGVLKPNQEKGPLFDPEQPPNDQFIQRIANAAKAGQPSAGAAPAENAPAALSPDPDALRVMCDALWPDPNVEYVLWYLGYDLGRPQPEGDETHANGVVTAAATA